MPEHEIYCEPFCGMASVFFAKPRSKQEALNDANSEYVEILEFLRDASDADWEKIEAMEWAPSEKRWEKL